MAPRAAASIGIGAAARGAGLRSLRAAFVLFALVAFVALVGPGCSRDAAEDGNGPSRDAASRDGSTALRAVDARGREVVLAAPPRRIVSLAPSNTEIIFALGLGDRLVGRDPWSDEPEAARAVPSIGDVYPRPNLEAIVLREPDLVLGAGVTNEDAAAALEGLGIPVYVAARPEDLETVVRDIERIGALVGREAEARRIVSTLEARIAAVAARAATVPLEARPRVFYELDGADPLRPWTAGSGTLVDELIGIAGGRNIAHEAGDGYFVLGLEAIILADPEIILLGSATHGGTDIESVRRRPGWSALRAVAEGRVYALDDDLVSRPGPRIAEGVETLASRILPRGGEDE